MMRFDYDTLITLVMSHIILDLFNCQNSRFNCQIGTNDTTGRTYMITSREREYDTLPTQSIFPTRLN